MHPFAKQLQRKFSTEPCWYLCLFMSLSIIWKFDSPQRVGLMRLGFLADKMLLSHTERKHSLGLLRLVYKENASLFQWRVSTFLLWICCHLFGAQFEIVFRPFPLNTVELQQLFFFLRRQKKAGGSRKLQKK